MSQAKVDRYKKEKKDRAKLLKRKKIKKAVTVIVLACLVGAAIGFPLGKHIYKVSKERQAAKATISADNFDYWSQLLWQEKYQGITGLDDHTSTDTDADEEETYEDASYTDILDELLDDASASDAE